MDDSSCRSIDTNRWPRDESRRWLGESHATDRRLHQLFCHSVHLAGCLSASFLFLCNVPYRSGNGAIRVGEGDMGFFWPPRFRLGLSFAVNFCVARAVSSESLKCPTSSHQAITITLQFQTSSKDTLLPVSLASIHQCALILFIQTLALYKSFTYSSGRK